MENKEAKKETKNSTSRLTAKGWDNIIGNSHISSKGWDNIVDNTNIQQTGDIKEKLFAETLPDLGEYAILSLDTLHLTFDNYFYVWVPQEVSIDEEIQRNKELQETKIVTNLETAKKAGKITTFIYNAEKITVENFDIFYSVKLKEYLKKLIIL